jgi:hypothetical protein
MVFVPGNASLNLVTEHNKNRQSKEKWIGGSVLFRASPKLL